MATILNTSNNCMKALCEKLGVDESRVISVTVNLIPWQPIEYIFKLHDGDIHKDIPDGCIEQIFKDS